MADISFSQCAQESIANGMHQNIGIGMALEPSRKWNLNTAEDKFPIRNQRLILWAQGLPGQDRLCRVLRDRGPKFAIC